VRTFIDTNIIVYANDARDAAKQKRAVEIVAAHIRGRSGVISTQVLQEYAAVALTKLQKSTEEVLRQLVLLETMEVVQLSPSLVRRAIELHGLYQLSFWDACILAAAESANCDRLLSEDLATGQFYSGVRVINPFDSQSPASPEGRSS